ncbi:MAG: glycoside hydrolase family 6 protein [Conexibacter sp.]
MRRRPQLWLCSALLAIAAAALTAAPVLAAGTVRLSSATFSAHESDRAATITVERSVTSGRGEVRYAIWQHSAVENVDYVRVRGRLDFANGQATASFDVPIVNDDLVESDETAKLGIYGAYPQRLDAPTRATLTILDDDVLGTRDALNPLALDPPPPGANPLEGARFYANPSRNLAGTVIRQIRHRKPKAAALLSVIADQPETKRFGAFNDQPGAAVAQHLATAHRDDPVAVPLIATYRLKHVSCGGYADSPEEVERYKRWYEAFARGIGSQRVVLFYEIDALITTKCLSRVGLRRRLDEVRTAIGLLAPLPHAVVYVDAGAGDAHGERYIARLLRRAGVGRIQGFFTNSTHQDWTRREIAYGRKLVRRLGGKPHYVINTAVNGRGPLIPMSRVRFGNSFRCNAPGRGLGPKPTSVVPARYRNLDGFFWIGNPGRSAGACSKTPNPPPAGRFWLDYAIELIRNADYRIR